MTVTALVNDVSDCGFAVEHGLSLFIETASGKKILFDTGHGDLFISNASRLGIRLEEVDIAVISHGHDDHGGGLRQFLEINRKAPVYIRRSAFEPHFSLRSEGLVDISLDRSLLDSLRLRFCGEVEKISDGITLFSGVKGDFCRPGGNRLLFGPKTDVHDDFRHEQNMIIGEGAGAVLFSACSHSGILNIAARSGEIIGRNPSAIVCGMHLVKSGLTAEEEEAFIEKLAEGLGRYRGTDIYAMHCTGMEQFQHLRRHFSLKYLFCGESITL